MLSNLVTDRTAENVNKIKELSQLRYQDMTSEQRQEWIDNLKGCYLYTDLNRVEEAVEYVGNKIRAGGLKVTLRPKKVWNKTDVPRQADIQRYLENIKAIRDVGVIMTYTPNAPTNVKINWSEANDIEQILHDVELMLVNITETYIYSGEVICGGNY